MAKAKQTAKTANAKTRQATAEKSGKSNKSSKVKDLSALETKPKTPEVFKSACGFDFDPAVASSCNKTCKGENPEAFSACEVNFKATATKKVAKASKNARGKNIWGHLNGCQGALIDDAFINSGGGTIEDLMKSAGATRPRVISHLKHLYAVWNVDLRITEDKKYFIEGMKSEGLVGLKSNGVKVIEVAEAA